MNQDIQPSQIHWVMRIGFILLALLLAYWAYGTGNLWIWLLVLLPLGGLLAREQEFRRKKADAATPVSGTKLR